MKKIFAIAVSVFTIAIIVTMIAVPSRAISSSENANSSMTSTIPDSVNAIIEKSCFPCHSSPGNGMAMMHIDFGKWDTYKPQKQADKAKSMCNKVTKGSMPPKSFRSENPDKVPTPAQVQVICNWAASMAKK
jgi:hypothetical protein